LTKPSQGIVPLSLDHGGIVITAGQLFQ